MKSLRSLQSISLLTTLVHIIRAKDRAKKKKNDLLLHIEIALKLISIRYDDAAKGEKQKKFFIAVNRKLNSGWKRIGGICEQKNSLLRLSINPIAYRMDNYTTRNLLLASLTFFRFHNSQFVLWARRNLIT